MKKCDVFFVCLFIVMLWNDKICDNGNTMKQCNFKTIMVSLHRGRFLVVHLYSTFSVDPQNFPLGQIYTKSCDFFLRFVRLQVHIFKARMVKFGMRVKTWESLP